MLMTETGSEIQEIKVVGKLRPIDMIGIRHVGQPGKIKTSLLILCEDGSLRVCDSSDSTEFWLNPRLRPHPDTIAVKSSGGKKANARKISKHVKTAGGQIAFPVDFFEHCQSMNDIEFGGNDLLQIYNIAQLKNRLNSAGKLFFKSIFECKAHCSLLFKYLHVLFRNVCGFNQVHRIQRGSYEQ